MVEKPLAKGLSLGLEQQEYQKAYGIAAANVTILGGQAKFERGDPVQLETRLMNFVASKDGTAQLMMNGVAVASLMHSTEVIL